MSEIVRALKEVSILDSFSLRVLYVCVSVCVCMCVSLCQCVCAHVLRITLQCEQW